MVVKTNSRTGKYLKTATLYPWENAWKHYIQNQVANSVSFNIMM